MSKALFFAEDPGAVNMIAPVLAKLQSTSGISLFSCGLATNLLKQLGLNPRVVADDASAVVEARALNPRCVVVGTSENARSPALALIKEGRASGRTTVGVVDFAANSAFRFRGETNDPLAYAPDWLLVPDQWTAAEYEGLGFAGDRIRIVGHPQYDATLNARRRLESTSRAEVRARLFPDADDRKIIVFVSEISTGLDPEQYRVSAEYTLKGRGDLAGRTEIVVEELLDALQFIDETKMERPYLVLRRHPKEEPKDLGTLVESFDQVSIGGDPLELIYAADLAVGMTSMLLMEAFLLGVPTLSILPRASERAWLPITRTGAIPAVTDRTELQDELRRLLSAPQYQPGDVGKGVQMGAASRILEFVQEHTTTDPRMAT